MNSKAALCMALLEGRVLNIKNCFTEIGLSNIGREIPRLVEKPFGVIVSRTPRTGKNRYKEPVTYTDYRLNRSEHNKPGIKKIVEYINSQLGSLTECKTDKQLKQFVQQKLFLDSL